jgi:dTDP-glucose 4,6-dehydratase
MQKKIVYLTGCLGFIGSHFTRKCLNLGWSVYGVDKITYAANLDVLEEFQNYPNFKFEKKDIKDVTFIPDCDYVVNFSAESHVGNSILDSKDFLSSNILGVANLLEKIRAKPENCGDKPVFVQISTDEVYSDIKFGSHTEKNLLKPSNPYSASKAAADMLVLAWARTYGLNYNIIRPSNNYGTHQYAEKLIPLSIKNLSRGKKIRLHDNGEPIRNWLHVSDTVNAILTVINFGCVNEIYNIAGDTEQTNIETVKQIISCFFSFPVNNWRDYIDFSYTRQGQDERYSVDDSKLCSLGWANEKLFKEEIEEIVKFYKTKLRVRFW